MKLSIQQLMRVYDPTDPGMTDRVKKMMESLIEQIDGLTRIANEFSNFAKMPEPTRELHDVVEVVFVREVLHKSADGKITCLILVADTSIDQRVGRL